MAVPRNSQFTVYTANQMTGESEVIGAQTIAGLIADTNGDILLCTGTTIPSNGGSGYAKGCIFIDTDVADGTSAVYFNKGIRTSCGFSLVTVAAGMGV